MNHSAQTGYDTRSVSLAEFNKFEFRVFLLQDWLLYQDKKPSLPYYLPIVV